MYAPIVMHANARGAKADSVYLSQLFSHDFAPNLRTSKKCRPLLARRVSRGWSISGRRHGATLL